MMFSSGSYDMNGFPFVSLVRFECDPAASYVYRIIFLKYYSNLFLGDWAFRTVCRWLQVFLGLAKQSGMPKECLVARI